MSPEFARMLVEESQRLQNARLLEGSTQRPFNVQTLTLELDTAKLDTSPLKIGFPFRTIFVRSATDSSVNANLRIGSRDSIQGSIPLYQNDVLEFPYPVAEAYLDWSAQSGKTMQLVFLIDGSFRIGSLLSNVAGGVAIIDGSSFSASVVSLAAATATEIFAASSSRKLGTIQNNSGASIWIGDSTVTDSGATVGYEIQPGATFYWRNAAPCYGYSVAGGDIYTSTES